MGSGCRAWNVSGNELNHGTGNHGNHHLSLLHYIMKWDKGLTVFFKLLIIIIY
jgi:hypothetical protein